MNIDVKQNQDGTYDVYFGDVALVQKDAYAKTDIIFSGEQTERNDFAELHISTTNTDKQWTKCEREITPEVIANPDLNEKIDKLSVEIGTVLANVTDNVGREINNLKFIK